MNTHPDQTPFAQRLQERIARSRFFTFSLLLHVIIVVVGGGAVLFHRVKPMEDFLPPGALVETDEPRLEPEQIAPPTRNVITANIPATPPQFEFARAATKMPDGLDKPGASVRAPLTQRIPTMTGLAVLAFRGHGELPESPEFGPNVKLALDRVLARGHEFDGRMSVTKGEWGGRHGVYEHAMLTYAMGEYY